MRFRKPKFLTHEPVVSIAATLSVLSVVVDSLATQQAGGAVNIDWHVLVFAGGAALARHFVWSQNGVNVERRDAQTYVLELVEDMLEKRFGLKPKDQTAEPE